MNKNRTTYVKKTNKLFYSRHSINNFKNEMMDHNYDTIESQVIFDDYSNLDDINIKKKINFYTVGSYYNIYEQKERLKILDRILSKIKITNIFIAILSITSIVLSIIDYEVYFRYKNIDPAKQQINNIEFTDDISVIGFSNNFWVRYTVWAIIAILVIFNTLEIYYSFQLERENYFVPHSKYISYIILEAIWFINKFFRLLVETIILICHPLPIRNFVLVLKDLNVKNEYSIDIFLYIVNLFKVFFYTRVLIRTSEYNNLITIDFCYKYGCKPSLGFIVRCLIKSKGFQVIIYSFLHILLILAYILRIVDNKITSNEDDHDNFYYLNNMVNTLFIIITSITTVGYGEFYVVKHISRFIIVLAVILGQFIISLLIVTVIDATNFDDLENKSFIILQRLLIKKKKRTEASNLIQIFYKSFKIKSKLLNEFKIKLKEAISNGNLDTYYNNVENENLNFNKNITKSINHNESNNYDNIEDHSKEQINLNKSSLFQVQVKESNESKKDLSKFNIENESNKLIYQNEKLFNLIKKREKKVQDYNKINNLLDKETFEIKDDKFQKLQFYLDDLIDSINSKTYNLQLYESKLKKALIIEKKLLEKQNIFINKVDRLVKHFKRT